MKWIIIIIFIIMAWYVLGEIWEEKKREDREKERKNYLNEDNQEERFRGKKRW